MRLLFIIVTLLALLPAAPPPQLRAFWVDAFNSGFKTQAQVEQLVQDAAAANINTLIVQVRRRGDAYYLGGIEPRADDPALAPYPYDPLRVLLDTAHARSIQVHAWIAALIVWSDSLGTPPPGHVLEAHGVGAPAGADWVMRGASGETTFCEGSRCDTWLDPGHPAVVAYTEDVARALFTAYPDLDGLHLDRIRYPAASYGYNSTAIARFNARYGRSGAPAATDALWAGWRREQVTAVVRRIAVAAAELAPQARISAAVIAWGDGPGYVGGWEKSAPYQQVLQDWREWLRERLLDTAIVMNYDREHVASQRAYFDHWLAWETTEAGGEVVVGVAAYLNSIDGTLAQVSRAQASGAIGVALYSYAGTNKDAQPRAALLDALKSGPFATPAAPPPMPWKAASGALHGTLAGVPLVAGQDGVSVTLDGPERRIVTSDGAGWYGAARLLPGEYNALVRLDADRIAHARATVTAGSAANMGAWSVVELSEKTYLPNIAINISKKWKQHPHLHQQTMRSEGGLRY